MADLDSLLTEKELELFRKAENCTTNEELQKLEKETNEINEGISQTSHIIIRINFVIFYNNKYKHKQKMQPLLTAFPIY